MALPRRPSFSWTPADLPDQSGRVAVVTGASSGLGAVVAEALADHGAVVVMGVRDVEKGQRVRAGFGADAAARVQVRQLELADLESVARFARTVSGEHPVVDLLVNNAGVGRSAEPRSVQGFERTFATNHLGHFALTGLLLPALEAGVDAGADARVVSVGSNLYRRVRVRLPLDDLTAEQPASRAYVASKLAVLMFADELERRLRAAASGVRSLAAHPGVASTPMQRQAGSRVEWLLGRALNAALGRSPDAGALPLLFAATAPAAPPGVFLGPSLRKRDLRVYPDPLVAPADDRALAARLWQVSEQATGVHFLPDAAEGADAG